MSQINVRNLSNENDDGAPDIVGVSTFSATSYFVPPKGTTGQRPLDAQLGDLRFNTDSACLEYFSGNNVWTQVQMTSPDLDGGARAIFTGGQAPADTDEIYYITISTLGNTTDFGNISAGKQGMGALASRTRGINIGGYTTGYENEIEYVTISSLGNITDFGNLTAQTTRIAGTSSQTRGIGAGGGVPGGGSTNVIQYITIASTGDAVDFGDSTRAHQSMGGLASSVRGVFGGGYTDSPAATFSNTIDYITIATTGNAADFGDLTVGRLYAGRASNSTRGCWAGGNITGGTQKNQIDYVTIASTGNAADFGDLTSARRDIAACSSSTRGVWCGGDTPTLVNTIDYVEILTTGNAVDFGDQTVKRDRVAGCSNAHGGL